MEIIPRAELQLQCREIGHLIARTNNITDNEIDKFFEPLIETIETRTQNVIDNALDEFRGQIADREEDEELEDCLARKKAEILDTVIARINGNAVRTTFFRGPNKSTKNIRVAKTGPSNYGDISDEELLEHPVDSTYWDQYLTFWDITITDVHLHQIVNLINTYKEMGIVDYCLQNGITYDVLCKYINELQNSDMYIGDIKLALAAQSLTRRSQRRARKHNPY